MRNKLRIAAIVTAFAITGQAQATVLDLSGGTSGSLIYDASGATVTAGAATSLAFGDFTANTVCPIGTFGCNGIMTLTFDFDVKDVFFDYGYGNIGDIAKLTLMDGLGAILAMLDLTSDNGVVSADLSSYGTFRSILFDNTASTGAGYSYGNINYTAAGPAAVPLPASLPLLLAGLGGLTALRRKRRA